MWSSIINFIINLNIAQSNHCSSQTVSGNRETKSFHKCLIIRHITSSANDLCWLRETILSPLPSASGVPSLLLLSPPTPPPPNISKWRGLNQAPSLSPKTNPIYLSLPPLHCFSAETAWLSTVHWRFAQNSGSVSQDLWHKLLYISSVDWMRCWGDSSAHLCKLDCTVEPLLKTTLKF